ncbi:MAG: hypothetical protein KatS3mg130_0740 [Candidatus Sumerlaea sp.]|nr:MAG: hypothetical protein KatS3mg130_0740 [Candidatus Sumerlaea sp.]
MSGSSRDAIALTMSVHFALVGFGDFVQHLVNSSGLFTHRHHVDDEGRKYWAPAEGFMDSFPPLSRIRKPRPLHG